MEYLLLGGPAHGTMKEIDNGENEVTIFVPSPGNPIPSPFKYVRRHVDAETRAGIVFRQVLFVEQSMKPELATQALASVLMQQFAQELVRQFMEGGEYVGNVEESKLSGSDAESVQRSTGGSESPAPGTILIGK